MTAVERGFLELSWKNHYRPALYLAVWPLLLCATLVVSSLLTSGPEVPGAVTFPHLDKVGHFLVFGLIATLIYRPLISFRPPLQAFLVAVLLTSLFGAIDEWIQGFNADRFMAADDWIADTLGALLAVTLYARWAWYRNFLELPVFPRKESKDGKGRSRGADT